MTISIIIPVYSEAENIGRLISYLVQYKNESVIEIMVVDAGSTDDTLDIARREGAITVISPQTGRAAQMNYGGSLSSGDILYFIHADTFPPSSYANDITDAVKKGFDLGRYRTQFNSRKWYFHVIFKSAMAHPSKRKLSVMVGKVPCWCSITITPVGMSRCVSCMDSDV